MACCHETTRPPDACAGWMRRGTRTTSESRDDRSASAAVGPEDVFGESVAALTCPTMATSPLDPAPWMYIEDLTGRVIRLEAQIELMSGAAMVKRLRGD